MDMKEYPYEFAELLYYTPAYYEQEERIWPVRGGRNAAKPSYAVGPKQIECFSLHIVRSGRVLFEYPGGSAELVPGDLFAMFPKCTYSYRLLPAEEPLQMCWITFDGPGADALMEAAGFMRTHPHKRGAASAQVLETVEALLGGLREHSRTGRSAWLHQQSLLYRLFAELSDQAQTQEQPARLVSWIQRAVDYMKLHHMEGIGVQDVADFAGVNRTHFTAVFTEQMGLPPKAYLQKLQMEKAKQLLRQRETTITEIALTLGYPNLYSFSRAFKTYCGQYPEHFRSELGKKTGR